MGDPLHPLLPKATAPDPLGTPIAGRFRVVPEDFQVEELPAYAPSGEGEHLFVRFEKRGLTTRDAVRRIARALGCTPVQVGVAGQKDARAVTVQTVSLAGVTADAARELQLADIRVLDAVPHRNKLRTGHLAGNRFKLRLREVDSDDFSELRRRLGQLATTGLPNAFGSQRFGRRGDNPAVGRALLANDAATVVETIAGRASEMDTGRVRDAREQFDAGDFETAARTWPHMHHEPRVLCKALASGATPERAVRKLSKGAVQFYVSAFQSALFNEVLNRRKDSLGQLFENEPAYDHSLRRVVETDCDSRAARVLALELSPTGPMFGRRCAPTSGAAGELERSVLADAQVDIEAFRAGGPLRCAGERRPLRVPLGEVTCETGADESGPFLTLGFDLPPGTYATTLLDAVCAGGLAEGSAPGRGGPA